MLMLSIRVRRVLDFRARLIKISRTRLIKLLRSRTRVRNLNAVNDIFQSEAVRRFEDTGCFDLIIKKSIALFFHRILNHH
jgi:hypothetical protein